MKRVRLEDIASTLGLSPSAVSLALRDSPKISKKITVKVKQTAARMGYVYNRAAAELRRGEKSLIGICINDLSNPVFVEFVREIEEMVKPSGYRLTLWNANETVDLQSQFLGLSMEYGVAGVLMCPVVHTSRRDLDGFLSQSLPIVFYSRFVEDANVASYVSDDFKGTFDAVKHLYDLGHRRIAWLGGGQETSTAIARLNGFRAAAAQMGMEITGTEFCRTSRDDGYGHVQKLLQKKRHRPTGIVAFADLIALGAIAGCRHIGLEVGKDVSLIGHDDSDECRFSDPPLTSVHVDKAQIAKLAVNHLLVRLKDPDVKPERILVSPTLVVRESTGAFALS